MIRSLKNRIATATPTLVFAFAITTVCNVAHANPITGALGEIKPLADIRLRYEWVDQAPPPGATFPSITANALNLRSRLGFETGKAWNTSLLVEGEFVVPIEDNYRFD